MKHKPGQWKVSQTSDDDHSELTENNKIDYAPQAQNQLCKNINNVDSDCAPRRGGEGGPIADCCCFHQKLFQTGAGIVYVLPTLLPGLHCKCARC